MKHRTIILIVLIAILLPCCLWAQDQQYPPVFDKSQSDQISINDLEIVLRTCVDFSRENRVYFTDNEYALPELWAIQSFLADDDTDQFDWVPEYYDCDDFAHRLMGNFSNPYYAPLAIGIALSGQPHWHWFCLVVCRDRQVYVIEPQNDNVFLLENAGECYQPILVIM